MRLTPVCRTTRRRVARVSRRTGISAVPVVTSATSALLLLDAGLLRHVCLIVLRQVRLLTETLAAQRAGEGLLASVRSDVNVHAVLVLETFAADAAVMQGTLLALNATRRTARGTLLLATGVPPSFCATVSVTGCIRVVAVPVGPSAILLGSFRRGDP